MIVGRHKLDLDTRDPQERLPLETRRVEARPPQRRILLGSEDVQARELAGRGRGAMGEGLGWVDAEGEELEEGADRGRGGEPASRVGGHGGWWWWCVM